MKKYLWWYIYEEPYVSHDIMVERMVRSTSSASNVHRVVDDNSNPYRNMVMDAIRMNQGHTNQCSILDEEPNVDATRLFHLLKDYDKSLWDGCINHSKLSTITKVFTIKSDRGLSEAGYERIVEWTRSILLEGNRLKDNVYIAKSMMKSLDIGYQKISMCSKFCMLYYLENTESTKCRTCGHSCYKPKNSRGRTLIATKKLRYFSITPKLQRLFMSSNIVKHIT
jgi:hypothetical protein